MTNMKPAMRPQSAQFSSGPCAKIPGWTPQLLDKALTGRSHRSSEGKARLKLAIQLTREVLEVPANYLIGIVPASDTGAVEMALWSLLGARGVDMLAWESFGEGWVSDVLKQLKLKDARQLVAPPIRRRSALPGSLRSIAALEGQQPSMRTSGFRLKSAISRWLLEARGKPVESHDRTLVCQSDLPRGCR